MARPAGTCWAIDAVPGALLLPRYGPDLTSMPTSVGDGRWAMVVPGGATPFVPAATGSPPAAPVVPRSRSFWVGLVLVVLGGVGGVAAVVGVAMAVVPSLSPQALRPSGETAVDLDSGEQAIWQATGRTSGGGGFTFSTNGRPTVRPGDLRVVGPDGADVPVTAIGATTETLNQGGQIWTAVAHVEAPRSGAYRVTVRSTSGPELAVGPSIGTSFRRSLPWIVVGVASGTLLVVGTIVMIVAAVRRSSARKRLAGPPPGVPMGPPPGAVPGYPYGVPYDAPGARPYGSPGAPPGWPASGPPR